MRAPKSIGRSIGVFHRSRGGLGRPARPRRAMAGGRCRSPSLPSARHGLTVPASRAAAAPLGWAAGRSLTGRLLQLPVPSCLDYITRAPCGLGIDAYDPGSVEIRSIQGVWTRQGPRFALTSLSNHHAHAHINRAVSGQIRTLSSWAVTAAAVCCRASPPPPDLTDAWHPHPPRPWIAPPRAQWPPQGTGRLRATAPSNSSRMGQHQPPSTRSRPSAAGSSPWWRTPWPWSSRSWCF